MLVNRAARVCALALAFCLWAPRPAAQTLRESVTDSALVDFASVATFKIIAGYVAQAAQGAQRAWIITVPTGLARWDSLARHLRVTLRARDTTSADTARMLLTIYAPRLVGDTLVDHVRVHGLFQCRVTGTTWWEVGMTYEVRVLRGAGNASSPEIKPLIETLSAPCVLRGKFGSPAG